MHEVMKSPTPTQEWIREAQQGNRDAFERLVDHHRGRLKAVVQRRLGGHLRQRIEVDDVVQETFLRALQSLDSFREEGSDSFFHWLRGIAENLLLYWARQHQRTSLLESGDRARTDNLSPSKHLRREERFERLEAAMSGLSPSHREVILLARIEGLSTKEVANRLNKSPEAVKQMLWRALQKLATGFGETESLHLPPRTFGGVDDEK